MSYAELFLMTWAGIATVFAIMFRDGFKKAVRAHKETSILLAEVVMGDVKPYQKAGLWVVENDAIRMSFRKKEDGDGIQE